MKRWAFALAVALFAAAPPTRVAASAAERPVVLDVPFVPQSEDLCGGAAAAMVMRYWGARLLDASEFASLIDLKAHGISTTRLAEAVTSKGWHTYALTGTREIARHHLIVGRPIVALIRVASQRLHYVVVVGWGGGRVVFHDPALRPLRSMTESDFGRAWAATDRWMMLILPSDAAPRLAARMDDHAAPPASCAMEVAEGVASAADRAFEQAAARLVAARALCPDSSAPLTELAGVRLLERNYTAAAATAADATALNPADLHAWRTLATARYLLHQPDAALDAWNHAGDPVLDLVRIEGLTRTREVVVSQLLGVSPGTMLTASALSRGRRRLEDLPAVAVPRMEYVPVGRGQAEVRATLVEPSVVPSGWIDFGGVALGAAINRELAWTFSSPSGNGESVTAQWRWWENRPRVGLSASIPVHRAVLTIDGSLERQTFSTTDAAQPIVVDDRRSVSVGMSQWVTDWLRWNAVVGADQWNGIRTLPRATAGLEVRGDRDRVAVGLATTVWAGQGGFASARVGARWRSSAEPADAVLSAAVDGILTTERAPHDLWPGADTGQATSTLLRAHTSLIRGVIVSEAFGRQLVHATGEWQSRSRAVSLARLRGAVFVDTARAWRGDFVRDRALVDAGAGVRIGLSGRGAIRVDVAHGLTDGANALSADWVLPWPRSW
jgi:predicted double-glycine peptidase